MDFQYLYDNKAALDSAITQAIGAASMCWADVDQAGEFDVEKALDVAASTSVEVRRILTWQLSQLLDAAGIAREWNEAIETAIQLVEQTP
jgi:hypothetical protein